MRGLEPDRRTGSQTAVRRIFLLLLLTAPRLFAANVTPLLAAHAHNDYEHARPLAEALERGFCSVEADVWLVDGRLLVAHELKDAKTPRTLGALYLEPLRARVRANGGRIFPGGPTVVLLVDVKSEAKATYAALHEELKNYAEMLTAFRAGRVESGAVSVIVSGNRAVTEMAAQPVRYAAVDGRSADLDANPPVALVPLVSENWQKLFTWRWEGSMPGAEREALRRWVSRAHTQGRKVRFWNTPDRPAAWQVLRDAGVDLIGTDDLTGLQKFLLPAGP